MKAQAHTVERNAPNGWEVLAGLATFLIVVIGGFFLYLRLAPPPDGDLSQVNVAATMSIQSAALVGAVAPFFIWHRANALRAIGLVWASPRSIAIWSIALLAISYALDQTIIPLSQLWDASLAPVWATEAIQMEMAQSGLAITFLVTAIFAPLGEEVFFRGILFGWLRTRVRLSWAVLLQAILFGAVHVEIVHVVVATGTGIGLALARERTRSLWPAIGAHCLINAVAVIEAYLSLDGSASG